MKQSYNDVLVHARPSSFLSYLDNKLAAFLVYIFQGMPMTANFITLLSFIFVLIAIYFLLIFDARILFICFLLISYTLDNVDGIWARLKNQTSNFGKFFDPFLDKIKDYLIDLSFVIFYFDYIFDRVGDFRLMLIIISLYFILKGLYYMVRDVNLSKIEKIIISSEKIKSELFRYGGAEKFIITYPLLFIHFYVFVTYIIGHLLIYFIGVFINLYKILLNKE
jgi:phosphatidylglycerophosphate synthase